MICRMHILGAASICAIGLYGLRGFAESLVSGFMLQEGSLNTELSS